MYALLRYHYRDPDIHRRPTKELLRLFAELEWVRQEEAKNDRGMTGHAS